MIFLSPVIKCLSDNFFKNPNFILKDYNEERAVAIANYIIESNATVRQTARLFGISKFTVHVVETK